MRKVFLIIGLAFVLCGYAWERMNARSRSVPSSASAAVTANLFIADAPQAAATNSTAAKIDFSTQIKPILQSKCQPCHFNGGQMYQRMPFDRPETVKTLGTKLFTRIKNEDEQRVIRDFLAQ